MQVHRVHVHNSWGKSSAPPLGDSPAYAWHKRCYVYEHVYAYALVTSENQALFNNECAVQEIIYTYPKEGLRKFLGGGESE